MCPDSSAYICARAIWEKGRGFLSTQGLQRLEVGPILMSTKQQRSYLQTTEHPEQLSPCYPPPPQPGLGCLVMCSGWVP